MYDNEADKEAAERATLYSLGWFADPVFFGQFPKTMLDNAKGNLTAFTAEESKLLRGSIFGPEGPFLCINHYSSHFVRALGENEVVNGAEGWAANQATFSTQINGTKLIGPPADSGWLYVVPTGMRGILNWAQKRYNEFNPSFVITENGVDCPNEDSFNYLDDVLNDYFRVNFLKTYIENLALAIEDGVNVKGYFVWSLLDNFEWADGYAKRFGMVYVDFKDPSRPRTPKSSYYWYRHLATHVSQDLIDNE
jgi:beta-glucosidase/6-phospho-beta-glucosidase/beta-galactosidase